MWQKAVGNPWQAQSSEWLSFFLQWKMICIQKEGFANPVQSNVLQGVPSPYRDLQFAMLTAKLFTQIAVMMGLG